MTARSRRRIRKFLTTKVDCSIKLQYRQLEIYGSDSGGWLQYRRASGGSREAGWANACLPADQRSHSPPFTGDPFTSRDAVSLGESDVRAGRGEQDDSAPGLWPARARGAHSMPPWRGHLRRAFPSRQEPARDAQL